MRFTLLAIVSEVENILLCNYETVSGLRLR